MSSEVTKQKIWYHCEKSKNLETVDALIEGTHILFGNCNFISLDAFELVLWVFHSRKCNTIE